jgi:hypothetical protein
MEIYKEKVEFQKRGPHINKANPFSTLNLQVYFSPEDE